MSKKEKMKVYHGIPKSVTDEHTVFYFDFDGNNSSKVNSFSVIDLPKSNFKYIDSPTGYGVEITDRNYYSNLLEIPSDNISIDWWANLNSLTGDKITLYDSSYLGGNTAFGRAVVVYYSNLEGLKFTHLSNNSDIQLETITVPNTINIGWTHLRLVVSNKICRLYVNGKLRIQSKPLSRGFDRFILGRQKDYGTGTLNPNIVVSDLHISNIDRGDYFPNLPQDFIDGKAIIKPRMGQQQIKGDPLYSQVTELLVDSSAKLPKPYSNIANSDGTYTHLYKPELSVLNANLWNNTSKLKIKGLNGEIISGVIDSDTALCKVLKVLEPSKGTVITMNVSDTSKLSLQDNVMFVKDDFSRSSTVTGTVTSIDATLKQIQVTYSSSVTFSFEGGYLVESTASSSSPIVKSEDGTTVVGTWSGLGTNEATFTLGDNTDLSGKDLYVTYSLNIPSGNSDFSELPYSVDRAYNEVGLEMKPVSEIVIEDDFRGKVQGDTKICPHVTKYAGHTSLKLPQEFSAECNQVNINDISTTDGSCGSIKMASPGIPQQLFSFNLIEVVERKLGCEIPSRDKIQWIIDNTKNITFNWWGYGNSPTRNFAEYQWWRGNQWSNVNRLHTFPRITKGSIAFLETSNITELLRATNDGMIHFLVYTDASDGVTSSVIYTQYVDLEIILKTDSTFTTLYCDNKRAREDSCNPVLIQKETKTVKRYLPSKECFVTECSYATIPSASVQQPIGAKKVSSHGRYFLSSKGTGAVGSKIWSGEYLGQFLNKDILYKYSGGDFIEVPYDVFVNKSSADDYASFFTQLELIDREDNAIKYLLSTKADVGYKSHHGVSRKFSKHLSLLDGKPESDFYGIATYLVEYNNELCLLISNTPYDFDLNAQREGCSDLYRLPNRPLIK